MTTPALYLIFLLFFSVLAASLFGIFFFFNNTATTEIYTLSLHDALPIYQHPVGWFLRDVLRHHDPARVDRKSTRLNSSHGSTSYAVFCLQKKKTTVAAHALKETKTKKQEIQD